MPADLWNVIAIAGAPAIASPLGGLIALWRRPTTLLMSAALGYAGGVLLGTIGFEMLPRALEASSLVRTVGGFILGFLAVYAFDLHVHRGKVAGPLSEQRPQVERWYQRYGLRGDDVTVLAGGTSAEELIEGLSIGVGMAIQPGLGLLVALAILIDNVSEALSIGVLVRGEGTVDRRKQVRRTLWWTSLIGVSLFSSALVGWAFLRGLSTTMLGLLLAVGAGGMFYLTIATLVPEAEERHYQQSAAAATAAGFLTLFVLGRFT